MAKKKASSRASKKVSDAHTLDDAGIVTPDDDDFFSELAEETGGDVLNDIDSVSYFVDTGNLALNYICSGEFITGGIPGGKLTEIYGPSSSSKSLVGTNILYGCQKIGGVPILIDCENSANKEFIQRASHCNLKRIVRYTPESLEKVFHKMYLAIEEIQKRKGKDTPIVIVYDSITVSPCERELREVKLPDNYTDAQYKAIVKAKEQPGERAKVCSRELRKLNTVMENSNATVVILNQTRDKIGVLFGNPETTGGGGKSLEFYASCRLRTQTQQKIEQQLSSKQKKTLGVNVKIKNMKNKTHRPFIETHGIQLMFEQGMSPTSGLLGALLDSGRITPKGSGFYVVDPALTNGEEYKFKASQERNDVDPQVLYDVPALIDAKTTDEVKDYLAPFQDSLNYVPGEDVVVNEVDEDDYMTDEEIDEVLG